MPENPVDPKKMMNRADYEKCFNTFWAHKVCDKDDQLDKDKVMRQLYDYYVTMREVQQVYRFLTGGKVWKTHTLAKAMIPYCAKLIDNAYQEGYKDGKAGKIQ